MEENNAKEEKKDKKKLIILLLLLLATIGISIAIFSKKGNELDNAYKPGNSNGSGAHVSLKGDKDDNSNPGSNTESGQQGSPEILPGGDNPPVNEGPTNPEIPGGNSGNNTSGDNETGNNQGSVDPNTPVSNENQGGTNNQPGTENTQPGNSGAGQSGNEGQSQEGNAGQPSYPGETVTVEPTKVPGANTTPAPTQAPNASPTLVPTKAPTAVPTKAPTAVPTKAPAVQNGTPVSLHGALSVKGTNLVDKNGNNFQLRGVSTHGIAWFPGYVNKAAFQNLRDDFGANAVRLAMYTHEYGGYCESTGNKENLKKIVNNGVQYATELGMYVIIDWHTLNGVSNNPANTINDAKVFWNEMSKKYASYNNVIYEICNEPNGGVSWSQVKTYAETIIKIIRANDPDAIILVGTPTWSQDVDQAAANPIKGQKNIMYNLHFYAGTHKQWLRDKMTNALNKGLPIFVSEFGITDASGNGRCDIAEADAWIKALNSNNISYMCWNLSNKDESSAIIKSNVSKTSGWTFNDLKEEGQWLVKTLGGRLAGGSASKPTPVPTKAPNTTATPVPTKAPTQATQPTKTPTQGTQSSGAVKVTEANKWGSGNETVHQYEVVIDNKTGGAIKNWKITITLSGNCSVEGGWNAKSTALGNTVTMVPDPGQPWARNIENGQSANFGIQLKGADNLSVSKVTISY